MATNKRKTKKGQKEPTQQTKINVAAIAPSATARRPYDNLVCFDDTHVEELKILQRLLPNSGSHPYKGSSYDFEPNIEPQTRYLDKYNTQLPNLCNNNFGDKNMYVAI